MATSVLDSPSFPAPEQLVEQQISIRFEVVPIAFIVFPAIVFALFLVSRICFAPRNTWDIWALYPMAFIMTTINSVICLLLVLIGGAGQYTAYLVLHNPDTLARHLKLTTAAEFVYVSAVALPKVALLLLYLRIFPKGNRLARTATWTTMAVVILHCLASGIFLAFAICQPFSYQWNPSGQGRCGNRWIIYKVYGIPNVITDGAILALPLPMLSRLQMGKAQKTGLLFTFLTASLGVVTAIIRVTKFFATDFDSDPVHNGADTILWTAIEPATYFVCSCLPSLRALLGPIDRFLRQKPVETIGKLPETTNSSSISKAHHDGNHGQAGDSTTHMDGSSQTSY